MEEQEIVCPSTNVCVCWVPCVVLCFVLCGRYDNFRMKFDPVYKQSTAAGG